MEKQFEVASERLEKIKELEGKQKDVIEHPEWI
jgi:hypothetical protein